MTIESKMPHRDSSDDSSDTDVEAGWPAFPSYQSTLNHDDFHNLEKIPTEPNNPTDNITARANLTRTFSRTVSRIRTAESLPISPAPDGGARAWCTSVLTLLILLNTWGFVNSFGVFQTYYVSELQIGDDASVAWIGSLQVFIIFAMGTAAGRATDAGFFKLVFITGTVVYLFGLFMLSLSTKYWQIFLSHAVCVGFGYGLVFVPSLAVLSSYFSKKRGTALGIAVSGSAIGGLVFPAIAEKLLPTAGFAWTIRTIAFVQMAVAVVCAIFMKPRLPPRKSGPLVEWSAFKELPYTLYLAGAFFFFWGAYIGFFYVGSYGRSQLNISHSTGINLLLVMNGVGVIGRVVPAILVDKMTGPLNMLIPFVLGTGLIAFSWIAVNNVTGLWIFSVVYGIAAAGIQGLFPVVLTSLTSDPKKLGVRSGMGFGICGFAVLTGPPISGALISQMNGSYLGVQIFAGATMIVSTGFLLAARWAKVGTKLRVKV